MHPFNISYYQNWSQLATFVAGERERCRHATKRFVPKII